jgi:4-amino-4-deoxy-L-arabinose transferase-like glycosyltransferase
MDVNRWRSNHGWMTGGFMIASGFFLFFNLWNRSLENHDYLRYAEVAREMIRSGDWIIPRYNGEVYLDKPPLLFWLIGIPSLLYGSVTPFIARFPSAMAAWIGTGILYLWGKRMYGTARAGIISAGILLSCYQYYFQARSAKTDMLLCLLVLLSLYFFFLGHEAIGRRRALCFGLSFLSMGLGVLTKGPFGFLIPFPVVAAFLLKRKEARILVRKEFIVGYLILLLIALPWPILFVERFGLEQSISLFKAAHPLSRQAPIYFYFLEIWGQFFPWSLLLPFLGYYVWRERARVWQSEESFLLIWFLLLFILLTFFKVRVSRYLLPALPPLALMLGGRLEKKWLYFLVPFIVILLVWQIREVTWLRKDVPFSPGRALTEEVRPIVKGSPFYGYRLDLSTLEELNFYLDPDAPVSNLKKAEDLLNQVKKEKKVFILMTKSQFDAISAQKVLPILLTREFMYKKEERLVLATSP